jgi:hypothetical protein
MYETKLPHPVAQGLVLREIKQRGKPAVYNDIIKNEGLMQTQFEILYDDVPPVVLNINYINAIFAKKDTDTLTKTVFDSITKNEEIRGYISDRIDNEPEMSISIKLPTNFIGDDDTIRYYWIEDNGQRSSVHVEVRLTNNPVLKKFVATL